MNISIVLASCNGAKYIREQLDSLARQTRLPSELIVSDDASSDDTLRIVQDFAEGSTFPVKIISNSPALGYADNFLRACEHAGSAVIALCDQDDVWFPEKLEKVAGRLLQHPKAAMVIHSSVVTDAALSPVGANHPVIPRTVFRPAGETSLFARPPGFAMTFRKSILDRFGWESRPDDLDFPSGKTKHDTWLLALANASGGIVFDAEPLAYYRRHDGNYSFFRKGSNLKRRFGQLLSLVAPYDVAAIKRRVDALGQHARFFGAVVALDEKEGAVLKNVSSIYEKQARLAAKRLDVVEGRRVQRLRRIVEMVRSGHYGSPGRLNRRELIQDVANLRR